MPRGRELLALPCQGVTHVVNCRAELQHVISQDLWAERQVFGVDRVVTAPMWDNGRRQDPRRWAPAADFAVGALASDPGARVLVHCQQGRRRSVLVAYAVLRLLGHHSDEAARLILSSRTSARLVPAYRSSVEEWLAAMR